MPIEYGDFYGTYRQAACRKVLGINTVPKRTLEARIRELMNKAQAANNKELAQVACDLAADEFGSSSHLLMEMDAIWKGIRTDAPEDAQREEALKII